MTLLYQEAQFISYPLTNLEPVKASHGWSNMVVFSEITDDSTVHVLNTIEFIPLVLSRSNEEGIAVIYV